MVSRGTVFAVALMVWFAVFLFGGLLIMYGHPNLGVTIVSIQMFAFMSAIAAFVRQAINEGTL